MSHAPPQPPPAPPNDAARVTARAPAWLRSLWLAAGAVSLVLGFIGIFLPVLPTTPFVLLAAWCFSRGSPRLERWLVEHPRFGGMVRQWRAHRAVPLRAKWLASAMMAISSGLAWWVIPSAWRWAPPLCCAAVAAWLWSLPSAPPAGAGVGQGDHSGP